MKHFGLMLLVSLLSLPALARDMDDAQFKDYMSLTKALRASGVDPVHVNWPAIEGMCLGLKAERNQVPYNRCRFEKATDSWDYPTDAAACKDAGRASTKPTVVVGGGVNTVIQPDDSGEVFAFDSCMRARGWINPQNAGRGRR